MPLLGTWSNDAKQSALAWQLSLRSKITQANGGIDARSLANPAGTVQIKLDPK